MSGDYVCTDCGRTTLKDWRGGWRCRCGGELLRVIDLMPHGAELQGIADEPAEGDDEDGDEASW